MPAQRRLGMDHEHYDWSPLVNRSRLNWPSGSRIAICIILNLGHMEWSPPPRSLTPPLAGGLGVRDFPDYARLSHREYGHRVGVFRVLDALENAGFKATVAMDALTAENYPFLVDHCLGRGCEIICNGVSSSQMISSQMSQEEEAGYIRTSIDALTRATGAAPFGWIGPEYGESSLTPQLLSQAGIRYICDWANDEQPYRLKSPHGELFALPTMVELDDVVALWNRRVTVGRYRDMLKESFDTLYEDGARTGKLLVINLHPWLIGQPFRIGYLNDALEHMTRRGGVWTATGSEIVDWYRRNPQVVE